MLEKKINWSLLFLAILLCFSATGAIGANILFVSSMDAEHMPGDDTIKNFLESLGHTVTYIDDDISEADTEEAALTSDLVYISESVGPVISEMKSQKSLLPLLWLSLTPGTRWG